jgi:prepilin-type processing-associated H-X9-DG protein
VVQHGGSFNLAFTDGHVESFTEFNYAEMTNLFDFTGARAGK